MINNITLIGYKNSGKSTIANFLAQSFSDIYNYKSIDTDQELLLQFYKNFNKNILIKDIYKLLGENNFRDFESIVIKNIVNNIKNKNNQNNNYVIATGGGVVLNPANISLLKKISSIIFLDLDKNIFIQRAIDDIRNKETLLFGEDSNNGPHENSLNFSSLSSRGLTAGSSNKHSETLDPAVKPRDDVVTSCLSDILTRPKGNNNVKNGNCNIDSLNNHYEQRKILYSKAADHIIKIDNNLSVSNVIDIIKKLKI